MLPICLHNKVRATGEEVWKNIFLLFCRLLLPKVFPDAVNVSGCMWVTCQVWCCCPLQQAAKKSRKRPKINLHLYRKLSFVLLFFRFRTSISWYLILLSLLLFLLVDFSFLTSLATLLRYGQKTRHLKIQQETYPPWEKR